MTAVQRQTIRRIAAALAAATAVLYVLVGLEVLRVVSVEPAGSDLLGFGLSAAAAFALGAGLLLATDRRILWALGAFLQVVVIVMYVAVAPVRTPPFEVWGVLIKVLQGLLLVALAWLAITKPPQPAEAPARAVARR
jgi:hypothetical protein